MLLLSKYELNTKERSGPSFSVLQNCGEKKWEQRFSVRFYLLFIRWDSVNRDWLPFQIWIKHLRTVRWEQASQVSFCTHQSPVNICTSDEYLQHKDGICYLNAQVWQLCVSVY